MKEHNFWNKFSKYLMVGLSALVLLMLVQSGMMGDFTKRGPQPVLADNEDFETVGPANPAFQEGQTPLEETVGPATPAFQEGQTPLEQPAAPEAPARPAAPAPAPVQPAPQQPAFVCPRVDVVDVVEDCFQGSVCKFNVWQGPGANGECINGRGGPFGCRAVPGSCGLPAQPVQPPPVQPPPAAPVQPAPAVPAAAPLPECPIPGQAGTVLQTQCNSQFTYDDFRVIDRFPDGSPRQIFSEFSRNRHCQGTILCAKPAVQQQCNQQINTQLRCVGAQLCNVNVILNTNGVCGNTTTSNPFNCQNAAGQCGFIPAVVNPAINIRNDNNNTNTNTITNTVNREVVREVQIGGNVGVATTAGRVVVADAKVLPKTGLPLLAYGIAAFVPLGFRFRRFSKVREEVASRGHFIWEDRQFKGDLDSN